MVGVSTEMHLPLYKNPTGVSPGCIQEICSGTDLTTKWVRCGAVPLLFASILPEAVHQVWVGAVQRSPSPGPLLQPLHPALGATDEVRSEELQSFL